jgi:hypothetical protein
MLIVGVQRSRTGSEFGGKGGKGVAVKAGRDRIRSQWSLYRRSRGGMIDAFASLDFNMGRRVLGATCPYFVTHHTVTFVTASFIYCVVSLVVVSLVVHVHVIE